MMEEIESLSSEILLFRKSNADLACSQKIEEKHQEIETLKRMINSSKSDK
jgi:chromosome segregation ATPase